MEYLVFNKIIGSLIALCLYLLVSHLLKRKAKEISKARHIKRARYFAIKRLITTLKNTKRELESEKLLPEYLLKQLMSLSEKLEDQIEI